MKLLTIALAVAALAGAARAEVTDKSAAGFEITHKAAIAAPAAKVYAALLAPGFWWNSSHSWSGDAKNLTMTYDVGGYAKGGLAEKWAAPVDSVLGEAVGRLKAYVETGKPTP